MCSWDHYCQNGLFHEFGALVQTYRLVFLTYAFNRKSIGSSYFCTFRNPASPMTMSRICEKMVWRYTHTYCKCYSLMLCCTKQKDGRVVRGTRQVHPFVLCDKLQFFVVHFSAGLGKRSILQMCYFSSLSQMNHFLTTTYICIYCCRVELDPVTPRPAPLTPDWLREARRRTWDKFCKNANYVF